MDHRKILTVQMQPKEIWEIDPSTTGKSVPAPNARINIKKFKFTVPGILLKLNLDQSVEAQCRQQQYCRLNNIWFVH